MAKKMQYSEYRRTPVDQITPGDVVVMKLVVTVGYGKNYSVFVGDTTSSDHFVERQGTKIPGEFGQAVAEAITMMLTLGRHCR